MTNNAPDAESDHEETYDEWFLRKAQEGLDRANSPDAKWLTHEEVLARSEARRAKIAAQIRKENAG